MVGWTELISPEWTEVQFNYVPSERWTQFSSSSKITGELRELSSFELSSLQPCVISRWSRDKPSGGFSFSKQKMSKFIAWMFHESRRERESIRKEPWHNIAPAAHARLQNHRSQLSYVQALQALGHPCKIVDFEGSRQTRGTQPWTDSAQIRIQ